MVEKFVTNYPIHPQQTNKEKDKLKKNRFASVYLPLNTKAQLKKKLNLKIAQLLQKSAILEAVYQ